MAGAPIRHFRDPRPARSSSATSIWRLVCACRLLNAADNTEIGVLYTTLAGDRQPAVVPNAAGTYIPEEYKPLASL